MDESFIKDIINRFLNWKYKIEYVPDDDFFFGIISDQNTKSHIIYLPENDFYYSSENTTFFGIISILHEIYSTIF